MFSNSNLLTILIIIYVLTLYYSNKKSGNYKLSNKVVYVDNIFIHENKDLEQCRVETWNNKTTWEIPRYEKLKLLSKFNITAGEGVGDGEVRLVSAFLYMNEVVVTTSRQRRYEIGTSVYCRYFDCNHVEIPGSIYKAFFYPLTSVHCLRKSGASYISLSLTADEEPSKPIPFIRRLSKEPQHELGVCGGQLYGVDPEWMQIAEFVEHHKLIGASMFYFSVFKIDGLTRMLLDEYERTGFAEISMINMEYTNTAMMRHMIQIHECFYRARNHSKWLLNIDHDEFLIPKGKPILSYVRRFEDHATELVFAIKRHATFNESFKKYNNYQKVSNNTASYNLIYEPGYYAPKVMFRPDKVDAPLLHWSYGMETEFKINVVPKNVAILKHHRTISPNLLWSDSMANMIGKKSKFLQETLSSDSVEKLRKNIANVVGYVFMKHNTKYDAVLEN